eukprot:gene8350-10256_t
MAGAMSFLDLPLPPPPTQSTDEDLPAIIIDSLPPPPPILSIPSTSTDGSAVTLNNQTKRPPPPVKPRSSLSLSVSGNGIQNYNSPPSTSPHSIPPTLDIFTPNKKPPTTTTTIVTTTTTTITRLGGSSNENILKTASGRRSIRSRSTSTDYTQQKKTIGRKDGVSLQNVEGLQNIGEALEEETLNFLDLVNEKIVNPESNVLFTQTISKIYEHLQILFILIAESASSHHGSKIISQITDRLAKGGDSSTSSSPTSQWYHLEEINASVSGIHNLLNVKKNLVPAIAYLSNSVRILGLQASLEVDWMSRNKSSEPEKIVVQLACLSGELISSINRLIAATSSYCGVCKTILPLKNDPSLMNRVRSPSTADIINIWDELRIIKEIPTYTNGTILKATLNQLVLLLTNDSNYDSKFLKTFITTYQSFASPGLLLTKLIERFNVPEWYTTNKTKISTIQQRVIVFLKYWIVNQSSDFDQDVIDQIYYFIDTTLTQDGYAELSKLLKELMDKMIEDREVKLELLFQMPPRIQFEEDSILSPMELFSDWSPQSIAQQLTLIDFSIFKEIEARELLNQNFNKPKMKYRAPNVMRMINRSTQISYWVAMVILLEGKKEKRLKHFEKFLDIAKHLLKMNNLNTLMSLIAGLNMTPVHRLKKTKKKLSSSALSTLSETERIFSSKKSFKNYRDHLTTITPPCIPYLGFNLTDLTFIDEGNPDTFPQESNSQVPGLLINFKKREQFYQAWNDLSHYQQYPYPFQQEEPLNTFLLHFPVLDEKDLYDLSTSLEPR